MAVKMLRNQLPLFFTQNSTAAENELITTLFPQSQIGFVIKIASTVESRNRKLLYSDRIRTCVSSEYPTSRLFHEMPHRETRTTPGVDNAVCKNIEKPSIYFRRTDNERTTKTSSLNCSPSAWSGSFVLLTPPMLFSELPQSLRGRQETLCSGSHLHTFQVMVCSSGSWSEWTWSQTMEVWLIHNDNNQTKGRNKAKTCLRGAKCSKANRLHCATPFAELCLRTSNIETCLAAFDSGRLMLIHALFNWSLPRNRDQLNAASFISCSCTKLEHATAATSVV